MFAAVGGLEEVKAGGTVLGVDFELVLDVKRGAFLRATLHDLYGATTVLAAELGVVIFERLGDGLDLPKGLIPATNSHSAAFDLTVKEHLAFSSHSVSFSKPRLPSVGGTFRCGARDNAALKQMGYL